MSLVSDLVAALRTALVKLTESRSGITSARSLGDDAIAGVEQATDGTSDPRPAEAVAHLQQAQERLDEAARLLNEGGATLEVYIADALGMDGGGAQATNGTTPTAPAGPAPQSRTAVDEPAEHPIPRPDMEKVKAIRPYVGLRKTVGVLTTTDGREVGGEIWSGKAGAAHGGSGLVAPWRHMETMTEHVEGHAAAAMRFASETFL